MVLQNGSNKTLITGTKVNLGSDATGDIYYRNSTGVLTRLGVGTNGQSLLVNSGLPAWGSPTPGGMAGGDLAGSYCKQCRHFCKIPKYHNGKSSGSNYSRIWRC